MQKFCKSFDQTGNILIGPGGTKSVFLSDSKVHVELDGEPG